MSVIVDAVLPVIFNIVLGLILCMIGVVLGVIYSKNKEESPSAKAEAQTAPSPQEDEPYLCSISALGSKHDADVHGIDYAFGQAEYEERNKIKTFILRKGTQGRYSCELDFPVSKRSMEWLKYSGFEVSQTDGKTLVSWENAKF